MQALRIRFLLRRKIQATPWIAAFPYPQATLSNGRLPAVNTKYVGVGFAVVLAHLSGCAAPDEVDSETLGVANDLAVDQTPSKSTPRTTESGTGPVTVTDFPASPPANPGTSENPSTPVFPSGADADAGVDASPVEDGSGGASAGEGGSGSVDEGTAGGGGASPVVPGPDPVIPPPEGEAPASMDWTTCDPSWATHFCPELDCATTELCSGGQAQYEEDCRQWCTANVACAANNQACINESDPLCIKGYSPRNKCVDYIDSANPKSLGASGRTNYDGSYGSLAAVALLQCACGAL